MSADESRPGGDDARIARLQRALATAVAAQQQPVIALRGKTCNTLQTRNGIQLAASPEPDTLEIEIWRYDPELFAQNGIVDQLSLYLSLQEMDDERVETARHHMMEQLPW